MHATRTSFTDLDRHGKSPVLFQPVDQQCTRTEFRARPSPTNESKAGNTCATTGNFSGKSSAVLVPHRMEHRVAIRDQWNESPWQALSNMRPSLAGTYTAHVADSQRSLTATRCSQYSARADSQKRRSPVPFKSPAAPELRGERTLSRWPAGGVAFYRNEGSRNAQPHRH
jgi:hypothetical protein